MVESETTGHPAAFKVWRMPFCWSVRICLFRVRAPVNSATWPYGPGVRKSGGFVIGIMSEELSALEARRKRMCLASKIKEGGWPVAQPRTDAVPTARWPKANDGMIPKRIY